MSGYENAVAVIGLAGRFPGADTVERFWTMLCAGRDGLTRFSSEELAAAGVAAADIADPAYVPVHGVVGGIEDFDADLFGMTPREAELTDPQQRLLLESARTALETAGYAPQDHTERIGVYVGTTASSYLPNNLAGLADEVGEVALAIGNDPTFLATRIAYKLNLRGPALTVQTACSTSLVAVHLACQSVLSGESDVALAGGASVRVPQVAGHWHTPNGIVSATGRCRSFDADADGTVAGDGAAVVVLKHAEAALADGDTVYALILGSAVNNDGAVKMGFVAPSVAGQAEVITLAHQVAGVSPDDISYVEAHATATELGDPIEVAALTEAFRRGTDRTGYCALGAVKPNIGHLDAASGVAGLVKAVLALHHETIPPTAGFQRPNPKISFDDSPFFVNATLRPWPRVAGAPRHCGVSSFGFGGTNAHVVLTEAPAMTPAVPTGRPVVLPLSARTAEALNTLIETTSQHLAASASVPDDVAHTLRSGRTVFAHRAVVVAERLADLRAPLLASARVARPVREVVFLFPGQGTLRPGMLGELYERFPVVRDTVDTCAGHVRAHRDVDLPDVDLRDVLCGTADPRWAGQPAVFTAGLALAELARSLGVEPTVVLGHSLGEYVAATVAGALSVTDALTLVARRGLAMADLPAGAMVVVAAGRTEIEARLPADTWIAGVTGADSVTVAGAPAPIAELRAALRTEGVAVTRVDVDHAFHTPLVTPALAGLRTAAELAEHRPLRIPLIGNRTGAMIATGGTLDARHWVEHAREPVRLDVAVATALSLPEPVFLELGAGSGLTDAVRRNAGGTRVAAFACGRRDPVLRERDVLAALAGGWSAGGPLDFAALPTASRRRVPLPTYPYQRQRYWVDPPGHAAVEPVAPAPLVEAAPEPADETVERVRRIWTELLGRTTFEPEVNFLSLGGTSLTAIQMQTRLRREFGVRLSLNALFDSPTIGGIADLVRDRATR